MHADKYVCDLRTRWRADMLKRVKLPCLIHTYARVTQMVLHAKGKTKNCNSSENILCVSFYF